MTDFFRLDGRRALVTGANTGIGQAIAVALARAEVGCAARRDAGETLDRIPAGRWGDPGDIGETAVFLCSRTAGHIHGAVRNLVGGWLAR